MKIEKNKIVFASILAIVIIFIVAYSALVLMGGDTDIRELEHPMVPVLEKETEIYSSKIEALEDLKVEKDINAPSIYSEKLLDSLGVFDPFLEEKKRLTKVDSITNWGVVNYREKYETIKKIPVETPPAVEKEVFQAEQKISSKEFSLEHRTFFASRPSLMPEGKPAGEEFKFEIVAKVNGDQKLRTNDRIELFLTEDLLLKDRIIPKSTMFYGFISLRPNRVRIEVFRIGDLKINLKAYDLEDGREGIYIENSFRSRAKKEVLGDIVQDINIAGLPQLGGIKSIFRRSNRNIKVNILDQYKFILKP